MTWTQLPKPILALAPMEDVTDTVFRRVVAQHARPDVFFTEFTNVDGLFSKGRDAVIQRLQFTEGERPIVAQIWGMKPENYCKAAQLLVEIGFDGIDINMGCPEKSVIRHGACIALMNDRPLAQELILATKEGILSSKKSIPLSIKTRIGFKTIQTEDWISFLLGFDLDALTVHGRTAAEMSAVPTHWDEIGKAVVIRNQLKKKTIILGNGDVISVSQANEYVTSYGVDGVMIGRGIFNTLWVFDRSTHAHDPSREEKLQLLLDHVRLFDETWGKRKNFAILKKFFKIYVSGFDGASELRVKLAQTRSRQEVEEIVSSSKFPPSSPVQ